MSLAWLVLTCVAVSDYGPNTPPPLCPNAAATRPFPLPRRLLLHVLSCNYEQAFLSTASTFPKQEVAAV